MSDNTAGRCQARRPGRLLEATCKRCPRGMAVTYRLAQAGGALQNPAYRPADAFENEGFGANTPDPSPILPCFIGLFEFGDNTVTTIHSEPNGSVRLPFDPKRAL